MPFPTTSFQIVAVIVLLLPGLVYAVVRRRRKGYSPDDLAIDTRIAQALVVSVLLDSLYFALGWSWFKQLIVITGNDVTIVDGVGLGVAVFVGCAAVPTILALLLNLPYRVRRRREGDKGWAHRPWRVERTIRSSLIPTAWDEAAAKPHQRMVRIQFPDGRWVGGFYGPGSFVSTFPQPRDIYISHQYEMDATGKFVAPIEKTGGVWLRISDEHVVEFVWPFYTEDELEELEKQ